MMVTSPISWIVLLFGCTFLVKKFPVFQSTIFVLSYTGVYVFFIYPNSEFERQYVESSKCETIPIINTQINLSEFQFINHLLDTIELANLEKPVVIETWNETCKPCINSIKDLQSTFTHDTEITYIYLYQNRGNKNLTPTEAFSYKAIKNPNQILIDIDNTLFHELELTSYPFFLIFNKKGVLTNYHSGYHRSKKTEIINKLKSSLMEIKEDGS